MAERTPVATKVFLNAEGEESRHASPEAVALRFAFANGTSHDIALTDLPSNIIDAAAWHGISQKLGDAYAGAKGDADEAVEAFETLIERLKLGEWVKAREGGGPRPSMVVDAIVAALQDNGEEVDDARRAAIMAKVKGPEARKGALANPVINAHYERLKLEAAKDRAKKAADKAKGAEASLGDF